MKTFRRKLATEAREMARRQRQIANYQIRVGCVPRNRRVEQPQLRRGA